MVNLPEDSMKPNVKVICASQVNIITYYEVNGFLVVPSNKKDENDDEQLIMILDDSMIVTRMGVATGTQ